MARRARANIVERLPLVSGRPDAAPKTRASRRSGVKRAMCSPSTSTATAGRATIRSPARDFVAENRPPSPVPDRASDCSTRIVPAARSTCFRWSENNSPARSPERYTGVALARALDRAGVGWDDFVGHCLGHPGVQQSVRLRRLGVAEVPAALAHVHDHDHATGRVQPRFAQLDRHPPRRGDRMSGLRSPRSDRRVDPLRRRRSPCLPLAGPPRRLGQHRGVPLADSGRRHRRQRLHPSRTTRGRAPPTTGTSASIHRSSSREYSSRVLGARSPRVAIHLRNHSPSGCSPGRGSRHTPRAICETSCASSWSASAFVGNVAKVRSAPSGPVYLACHLPDGSRRTAPEARRWRRDAVAVVMAGPLRYGTSWHEPTSRKAPGRSDNVSAALCPADTMERVTGIEPALSAWEAEVLPLNYTRATPPACGSAHLA